MKKLVTALALFPVLSFASVFDCTGAGFKVTVTESPLEMTIIGNNFDTKIANLKSDSTFDTIYSGNSLNPRATIKLVVKDSSYGNPGDKFKSVLLISSAVGIQEYSGLICIRGND